MTPNDRARRIEAPRRHHPQRGTLLPRAGWRHGGILHRTAAEWRQGEGGEMPPRPSARASAAAHSRRVRSSSNGPRTAHLLARACVSVGHDAEHGRTTSFSTICLARFLRSIRRSSRHRFIKSTHLSELEKTNE